MLTNQINPILNAQIHFNICNIKLKSSLKLDKYDPVLNWLKNRHFCAFELSFDGLNLKKVFFIDVQIGTKIEKNSDFS